MNHPDTPSSRPARALAAPSRPTRRAALRGAAGLGAGSLLALGLSACGVGTQNAGASEPAGGTAGATGASSAGATSAGAAGTASPSPGDGGTPSSGATHWDVPDPRSITGTSQAEDVGDVDPITDAPAPALPVTTTDADGYEVTVTDVSRILALDLYGTLSRTVEALGLGSHIVGRGQPSTEPVLASLPVVVQNGLEINVEAVLSLAPTVVLVDHSLGPAESIDQLRDAGTTVLVLAPERTLDSVESDIAAVGSALGVSAEAQELGTRARAEVVSAQQTIAQWTPAEKLRTVFLYVRGTGSVFFILGQGDGADVLIDAIGCEDIASENGMGELVPATAEALATLDPELILTMTMGVESTGGLDGFTSRAGVAQTTAGARQRIVTIPDGQSLSFGPQAGDALLAAARAVYQPVEA